MSFLVLASIVGLGRAIFLEMPSAVWQPELLADLSMAREKLFDPMHYLLSKVLLKEDLQGHCSYVQMRAEHIVSATAGDAIRPFLLDAYGGLYMDVDVECFDATNDMVDGFDLVLQLEDNGNKSLNNAVMAGAPGLDIWDNMQHLLKDR